LLVVISRRALQLRHGPVDRHHTHPIPLFSWCGALYFPSAALTILVTAALTVSGSARGDDPDG
jgi:hypothetical protein